MRFIRVSFISSPPILKFLRNTVSFENDNCVISVKMYGGAKKPANMHKNHESMKQKELLRLNWILSRNLNTKTAGLNARRSEKVKLQISNRVTD